MLGFRYPEAGSRQDYLMGAVMWNVATSEEQEEYRSYMRGAYLARWEERVNQLKAEVNRRIDSHETEALSLRSHSGRLDEANKAACKAALLREQLELGHYDSYKTFGYKGL